MNAGFLFKCCRSGVIAVIGCSDVVTCGAEGARNGSPNSTRATGDDCDSRHVLLPCLVLPCLDQTAQLAPLSALNRHGYPHTAANTQRCKALVSATAVHFMEKSDKRPCPG